MAVLIQAVETADAEFFAAAGKRKPVVRLLGQLPHRSTTLVAVTVH